MKVFWKKSPIVYKETPPWYQETKMNLFGVVYKLKRKGVCTSVSHRPFKHNMYQTGLISIPPTPKSAVYPSLSVSVNAPPTSQFLNTNASLPPAHLSLASLPLQWVNSTIISSWNYWNRLRSPCSQSWSPPTHSPYWNQSGLSNSWGRSYNSFPHSSSTTPCCFQSEIQTPIWQDRAFIICLSASSSSPLLSLASPPAIDVSALSLHLCTGCSLSLEYSSLPFRPRHSHFLDLPPQFFQADSMVHPKLSWVPLLCELIAPYTLLGWSHICNNLFAIYSFNWL